METDDQGKPGRGFFMVMGAIMIVVGVLVVAALVVPIQPAPPKQTPNSGVIMPSGAGNNQLNFSPDKVVLVIGVNNTVVWTNEDNVAHTVKSETIPAGADPFSSAILNNGQTFSVTLTVPGTYTYECTIHPVWMQATIVVVGATNSSNPSSGSSA
jgi:plastocyanin